MKKFIYPFLLYIILFSFIACEDILLEKDISDTEVRVIAPVDKAEFSSTSVKFSWEAVEDATQYHLQIARPNFTSPTEIVLDTIISSTSFTQQLNIGAYQWRIKAINSGYETPYSMRTLTILNNDDFENNTVILSTPTNNLITRTQNQNLSWATVHGAFSYQLQILDSNNAVISNQTITTTNVYYTFPEGNYQWKVRASNGTTQTLYSVRNILVDITPPQTPVLTSPANGHLQSAGEINFSWNRTPIAGSTEKDSIYIYTNSTLTALQSKRVAQSPVSVALDPGTFYWYVKSFDQAGNESAQSSVFSVTLN